MNEKFALVMEIIDLNNEECLHYCSNDCPNLEDIDDNNECRGLKI